MRRFSISGPVNFPYSGLEKRAFWKNTVSVGTPCDFENYYRPKFEITPEMGIFTAGSCFAQHIGRSLSQANFNVIDTEIIPDVVPDELANKYGYRLYSARYGNIYTSRQLYQLMRETFENYKPVEQVWTKGTRYYDAQRPSLEPAGLDNENSVLNFRAQHIENIQKALQASDIVVFTFGLTEAWCHTESGDVFPTAPGTIAGQYNSEIYHFKNFGFNEVYEDFCAFRDLIRSINNKMKFIITVSPVPLTATASGEHINVATTYSKSVLRAVCGTLYDKFEDVDYFPSYELVTHPSMHSIYFEANRRSVTKLGVEAAMGTFLKSHGVLTKDFQKKQDLMDDTLKKIENEKNEDRLVCEDLLLEAFADSK